MVRVVRQHQPAVGLADLLRRGVGSDPQNLAGLVGCHRSASWLSGLFRRGFCPKALAPVRAAHPVEIGFQHLCGLRVGAMALAQQRGHFGVAQRVQRAVAERTFQDMAMHFAAVMVEAHGQQPGDDLRALAPCWTLRRLGGIPYRLQDAAPAQDEGDQAAGEGDQIAQLPAYEQDADSGDQQNGSGPFQRAGNLLRFGTGQPACGQQQSEQQGEAENEIWHRPVLRLSRLVSISAAPPLRLP